MNERDTIRYRQSTSGFTLMELLVVVGIMALLMGILLPSLSKAKQCARRTVCASNIHQLGFANIGYAVENNDYYALAAEDIFVGFGGKKRWHGVRLSDRVSDDPAENHFDPALGPLASYLGKDGMVKRCPSFVDYETAGENNAFEEGTGGYGYNHQYIGGRSDLFSHSPMAARTSARSSEVTRPTQTVMFTDTAFVQRQGSHTTLIEYSFCETPYFLPEMLYRPTPSIHFRHTQLSNIVWVDGHVSPEPLTFTTASGAGFSESEMNEIGIGWFGPDSNELFDLD